MLILKRPGIEEKATESVVVLEEEDDPEYYKESKYADELVVAVEDNKILKISPKKLYKIVPTEKN